MSMRFGVWNRAAWNRAWSRVLYTETHQTQLDAKKTALVTILGAIMVDPNPIWISDGSTSDVGKRT